MKIRKGGNNNKWEVKIKGKIKIIMKIKGNENKTTCKAQTKMKQGGLKCETCQTLGTSENQKSETKT